MMTLPADLTLAMVSLSWACTPNAAAVRATASQNFFFIQISCGEALCNKREAEILGGPALREGRPPEPVSLGLGEACTKQGLCPVARHDCQPFGCAAPPSPARKDHSACTVPLGGWRPPGRSR